MTDEASSTITWETIAKAYKERAKRDYERIDELMQRANHWRDTADMLKRQRNVAEEDREGWKARAMQSEQQRQSLRDLLVIAEGQRDQAKIDAEHWKGEWAVVMGQLGGARAECEALRKSCELFVEWLDREEAGSGVSIAERGTVEGQARWRVWWDTNLSLCAESVRLAKAALTVQPTTGETDE